MWKNKRNSPEIGPKYLHQISAFTTNSMEISTQHFIDYLIITHFGESLQSAKAATEKVSDLRNSIAQKYYPSATHPISSLILQLPNGKKCRRKIQIYSWHLAFVQVPMRFVDFKPKPFQRRNPRRQIMFISNLAGLMCHKLSLWNREENYVQ